MSSIGQHWAAHRQMPLEGGFQGRTNKLVDSCYSYWMSALFPMIAPHTAAPLRTIVCNMAYANKLARLMQTRLLCSHTVSCSRKYGRRHHV